MSAFADGLLIQFTQDAFIADWLTNQVGLQRLFGLVYKPDTIDVKQVTLGSVTRGFETPAFETLRSRAIDERIVPSTERNKVEGTWPRRGRLEWVDVVLTVSVNAQIASLAMPIERISSRRLTDKIGTPVSLADLRAKLTALFAPSVVDAFFQQLRITSIDEFNREPALFLEFVYKAPPVFDPADPASNRKYPLNVCVRLQETFAVREALQSAKLCRSILENEEDFLTTVAGATVLTPYAFVTIFPNAAVVNNLIPGLTANQIKAGVQSIFQAENMWSVFA